MDQILGNRECFIAANKMRLRFSPESIEDLERLRDFIEQNNPIAA
jgi:hypothetical protein